jgi:hypothetical protein
LPDRILPATRLLAGIVVPVLITAFVILFLFPDLSRLFAWPIRPPMNAMMLGATYLGGAYFFTRLVFARQWHAVRLGLWPVTTFVAVLGIATLLHWGNFTHGSISFFVWAFLYFTLPFVIPVVWYLNRRANLADPPLAERPLPAGLSLAIGVLGGVLTAASLVLFLFPGVMVPVWPWTLSPLTARVMAAMFALPGVVGLGIAIDRHWSSASLLFQAQVVAIVLMLVAALRARAEIDWSQPLSWLFVASLLLTLGLIGWASWAYRRLGRLAR